MTLFAVDVFLQTASEPFSNTNLVNPGAEPASAVNPSGPTKSLTLPKSSSKPKTSAPGICESVLKP